MDIKSRKLLPFKSLEFRFHTCILVLVDQNKTETNAGKGRDLGVKLTSCVLNLTSIRGFFAVLLATVS